jgi:hypothetical protein
MPSAFFVVIVGSLRLQISTLCTLNLYLCEGALSFCHGLKSRMSNNQLPTANFQVTGARAKGHLKIGSWKLVIGHSVLCPLLPTPHSPK